MAGTVVVHKRNLHGRTKVKTGCGTCRIRKVKCDEAKPFCQKCVKTGRTCDGYDSRFRSSTSRSTSDMRIDGVKSNVNLQLIRPIQTKISHQEIDLLCRAFSTKTIFDVKLDCDEEAKQVLKASLTDLPVRHAISSLAALRKDYETSTNGVLMFVARQTPSYNYGLQQYSMALIGLTSNLSAPSFHTLRSALICCQMFISIEQVQQNYAAMTQHITQGLRIMHEYQARPYLTSTKKLAPAYHVQLPYIDVFIIKLFAAPCKFAEPCRIAESPATASASNTTSPVSSSSPGQQSVESRDLRMIAPNIRAELTKIATSTLKFLDGLSRVESVENAFRLSSEKAALLDSLKSWLIDLDLAQINTGPIESEPIHTSFLRLFHPILRIILLGALDFSPNIHAELRAENDRMHDIANSLSERLKTYGMCRVMNNGQEEQSKVH